MTRLSRFLTFLAMALPLRAATHTAASASRADVGTAYALCVDGDTLAIPAGTGSWHTTLQVAKAITVQGAGIGSTILVDDNIDTATSSQQFIKWTTEADKSYRMTGIEFRRALRDVTGSAATNVITCTGGHELAVGEKIRFVTSTSVDPFDIPLVGGAGIAPGTTYYVKTVPTADTFTISAALAGAELDFTTDITAGQYYRAKLGFPYDRGCFYVVGNSSAVRFDNCKFYNLQNEFILWYNAYGVIDHCEFQFCGGNGRALMFNHRAVDTGGVDDTTGDSSWESAVNWLGDRKAVYMEDCTFSPSVSPGNEVFGASDAIGGGGRLVFRFNTSNRTSVGNHGTETGQRYRGGRLMEIYGNTFDYIFSPTLLRDSVLYARSGTMIAWNNRFTGTYNSNIKLSTYRTFSYYPPWGIADGTKAWDSPDLTDGAGTPGGAGDGVFDSGTSTAAGSNSLTDSTKSWTVNEWTSSSLVTVFPFTAASGTATTTTVTSAGWTTNQWNGYEFTRASDNSKGRISSNTSDTLTLRSDYYRPSMVGGGTFTLSLSGRISSNTATALTMSSSPEGTARVYRVGAYEIRKVSKVLDDSGLGATTDVIGSPANHQSLGQGMDPCYLWDNLKRLTDAGAWTDSVISPTLSIKENRNWYKHTATFDGTVGVGSGTLAARPVTCTTGVGYWATDQGEWNSMNGATPDGQLYVATATDTWGLHYVPYTYPHPLTSEEPVTPDTTPPTLFSATIDNLGTTATLVFSENVTGVNSAHYTLSSGSLSAAAGSGPTWTMTLSPTAFIGDAARTISYTAGTTVDTAASPNALANFSGATVFNQSIQITPLIPGRLRNLQLLNQ